ncbi:hypothetical protein BHM03_00041738 [Ensete ventricosum]|nr:hypothetical protein BHM03_00041738 [Ensete ventricosum]
MAWLRSLPRFSCCPPSIRFLSTFSGASATAAGLGPTAPGAQKPRVVVLGTGWAGCRLMKGIDTRLYDVVCISPRNHMVFTPLLASTCVGTLEFRSVAEPVSRIQPAISTAPGSYFFLARCTGVDADGHAVSARSLHRPPGERTPENFDSAGSPFCFLAIRCIVKLSPMGVFEIHWNCWK